MKTDNTMHHKQATQQKTPSAIQLMAARYISIWQQYWSIRHQMDPPVRQEEERQFLPAHLELTESPVSPLSRWSMRLIISLAVLALVWSIVGKMDIVAVASGQIQADGRTKVIQPLESSVVSAIYVRNGQSVKQGELLIELDHTHTLATQQQSMQTLMQTELASGRYQALLSALDQQQAPSMLQLENIPATLLTQENALMQEQWQTYQQRFSSLSATLAQRQAEHVTTLQHITNINNLLVIYQTREQDYQQLLPQQYVSRHAWLEQKQKRLELQGELAIHHSRIQELTAAIHTQQQELALLTTQFRSELLDKQRENQQQWVQQQQEHKKITQRHQLTQLRAPVSGTVQQLAIHTVGGVVTEAQPLLAIVPDDQVLEVEVKIENKDIGFIQVGQSAVIKIESFPYTRYGYLDGTLDSISHDAMQDEHKGLVYQGRVLLSKNYLLIDQVKVNLTAGMVVTAEIKTGKRRVIDYFLSPLKAYVNEGLRER